MAKKKTKKTLGVYGSGSTNRRAANRLMPQRTEGADDVTVYFLVDDLWSASVDAHVLSWVEEHHTPHCVVAEGDEIVKDLKADKVPFTEADDPLDKFVGYLAEAQEAGEDVEFVILWDEEDEDNQHEIEQVVAAVVTDLGHIPVYDLALGMRPVDTGAGVPADEEEDDSEDASAPEEDDSPDVEDEDASPPDVDVDALSDTNYDLLHDAETALAETGVEAAETVLTDAKRSQVIKIAEALGIEIYKGMHTTTMASEIVALLGSGVLGEEPAEDDSSPEVEDDEDSSDEDSSVEDLGYLDEGITKEYVDRQPNVVSPLSDTYTPHEARSYPTQVIFDVASVLAQAEGDRDLLLQIARDFGVIE